MIHDQETSKPDLYHFDAISPNAWEGDTNCVVGPFSSKEVAEYFAGHVIDFGQLESMEHTLFVKGDSWFLEIQALLSSKHLV